MDNSTIDREIRLSRLLNAPIDLVWEVWTQPEHIKNWWGPEGFTSTVHQMDFREGGEWNFVMHGPDGTDYKNAIIFLEVVKHKKIVYDHVSAPKFRTTIWMEAQGEQTLLNWHMLFESREVFVQTVKTFKADQGLRQNADRLERYAMAQFALRKQLKSNNMARTSSYLNFNRDTEEAFNFYKKVFRSEFSGRGIQRLGDYPTPEGVPTLSEEDKNLILHIELPILGGHVLMATDAPESMGFTINPGNNMHIQLEPDSREEADRLFNELSEGGKIEMPMADMFFGSYFGHFTDRYGINWMINYINRN